MAAPPTPGAAMRRSLGVLAMLAVFALGSSSTFAARQPDWTWTYLTNIQVSEWIEQQSDWPEDVNGRHVVNPFGGQQCAWDIDDHWSRVSSGSLAPGQSVSATDCMVSDHNSYYATRSGLSAWWSSPTAVGRLDLTVYASSPDLVVTVCYEVQARCFQATPTFADRQWTYAVCTQASYNQPEPLPEIVGSNGGVGIRDVVTSTISNPTSHAIRRITFNPRVIGVFTSCLAADQVNADYPWRWWN